MSILINGMDMPRNCKECDYLYGSLREGYRCERLEKWLDVAVDAKRDPNCLVVAVPTPHGRLIDAGRLIVALRNSVYANSFFRTPTLTMSQIEQLIEQQPTIIEAEDKS